MTSVNIGVSPKKGTLPRASDNTVVQQLIARRRIDKQRKEQWHLKMSEQLAWRRSISTNVKEVTKIAATSGFELERGLLQHLDAAIESTVRDVSHCDILTKRV